jgi:hypothetical protein
MMTCAGEWCGVQFRRSGGARQPAKCVILLPPWRILQQIFTSLEVTLVLSEGSADRLTPILMTPLVPALGVLPLAIGMIAATQHLPRSLDTVDRFHA